MFDTLRAAHGDATLTVLLTGAQPGEEDRLPGASFLAIEQVVGDRWGLIAAGNPPGALPAAVLPHLLAALLGDGGPIIYIGAGVRVCGPLTALLEEVSEHEVALVARSRGDSELALPRGREGAFSRQLMAMRPGASSQRLLDSWPTFFAGEGDDGAGAVRSWLDGIPAVARDVGVVRDGACGADAETLGNSELGERDGSLLIEGSALTAIDLGQLDPGSPLDWPQESVRARLSELPALVGLLEQHAADLLAAGLRTGDAAPGHELAGGLRLTDTIRALLVEGVLAGAITSSPLTTSGREELYAYLNEQDPRGRAAGLSRLHMAIWDSRIELREVYSHLEGPDGSGYAGWLCVHGPTQEGLVPELLPHAPDGAYRQPDYRRPPGRGVNVVGFFTSELGVGEVARLLIAGLDAAQVTALPVRGQLAPPSRQGITYPHVGLDEAAFPINILCINGDGVPVFAREAGRAFFEGRYTIAVWWWEVGDPPPSWAEAYEFVDEVWTGSQYVHDAIAPTAPVPVVRVRLPVEMPRVAEASRAELGLPADGFLFVYLHDYFSVPERKNPLGLIEAFRKAFEPGSGARLVVKSINADARPDEHERTRIAAAGHPDISLVDGYVSGEEKNAIIAACDCYVSLHRSEGFGLTMAEAMLLGRPVIATGYGGSLEFMTAENSYLVDWRPIRVGEDAYPYDADAVWADPDLDHAASLMREVFENQASARERGELARRDMLERHSPSVAGESMRRRLELVEQWREADGAQALNLAHLNALAPAEELAELIADAPRLDIGHGRFARLKARVFRPVTSWAQAYSAHQRSVESAMAERVQEIDERLRDVAAALQDQQKAQHAETLSVLRRLEDEQRRAQDS